MSKQIQINDGGPAFPGTVDNGLNSGVYGMTLRDYFAAAALQGLIAAGNNGMSQAGKADNAYVYADLMLEVRNNYVD